MKSADFDSFNREISLIHQAVEKPFVLKAHLANWHLPAFAKHMKNVVYVHLPRNPVDNIRDICRQVAGQINFIEKTILADRAALGNRCLRISKPRREFGDLEA